MNTDRILLAPFCDPTASRYSLAFPWRDQNGKVYATTGKMLIECDNVVGVRPADPDERVPDPHAILRDFPATAEWRPVPAIELPSDLDTTWHCEYCFGTGSEGGHECNCEFCERPCHDCDGTGIDSRGRERVEFVGKDFQRMFLWAIGRLPNCLAAPSDIGLWFRFDGGRGAACELARPSGR